MGRVTTKGAFGARGGLCRPEDRGVANIAVLGMVAMGGVFSQLLGYGWTGLCVTALALCVARVALHLGRLLATVGELDLDGED